MKVEELALDIAYTDENETETREIRRFIHRNGSVVARYRYKNQEGPRGEGWLTIGEFATWAHHTTPFRLPPRARKNARQSKSNRIFWRGDFDFED